MSYVAFNLLICFILLVVAFAILILIVKHFSAIWQVILYFVMVICVLSSFLIGFNKFYDLYAKPVKTDTYEMLDEIERLYVNAEMHKKSSPSVMYKVDDSIKTLFLKDVSNIEYDSEKALVIKTTYKWFFIYKNIYSINIP